MDLTKILRMLYDKREQVLQAITALEEMQDTASSALPNPSAKRLGRKSMGAEERRQVSKRMREYWAQRHEEKK